MKHRYLKSLNAPIDSIEYELPDLTPDQGIYVVDTRTLFAALEGRANETRGLARMCALLGIPDLARFHNAGNDSYVRTHPYNIVDTDTTDMGF